MMRPEPLSMAACLMSRISHNSLETGKREGAIKTLRAISAALQVTVDDLQ
jgi:DNA-binding XRE family transcriptional regulator